MSARISSAVTCQVSSQVTGAAELGQLGGAIKCHPAHQLRRHVVLRLAVAPPRSPGRARARRRSHNRPGLGRAATAGEAGAGCDACGGGSSRARPRRRRSGADRTRRCRSRPGALRRTPEVGQRRLRQIAPAVDPVHDLQAAVLVHLEIGDVLHELVGFSVEVQPVQRLQRERGIAQPAVPVVPVALASGCLR